MLRRISSKLLSMGTVLDYESFPPETSVLVADETMIDRNCLLVFMHTPSGPVTINASLGRMAYCFRGRRFYAKSWI